MMISEGNGVGGSRASKEIAQTRGVRVEILCESGQEIGLGHLYRCIKLARILAQIPEVAHIALHNRGDFAPEFGKIVPSDLGARIHFFTHEWLCEDTLSSVLREKKPKESVLAIVDSYMASREVYAHIKRQASALICLDDTLRDVYPPQSYILNPTLEASTYFAPKPYHLWCGEEFAIVPQYAQIKPQISHASIPLAKHIFVNFGGVDSGDLTQAFLQGLRDCLGARVGSVHFHIVLGGGYTHTLCPSLVAELSEAITIYRDLSPDEFLSLAQACDYAISAGGGSMLELLTLQIPSIILESAPNQRAQIAHFADKGAIIKALSPKDALYQLAKEFGVDSLSIYSSAKVASAKVDSRRLQDLKTALAGLRLGSALPQALRHLAQLLHTTSHAPTKPK